MKSVVIQGRLRVFKKVLGGTLLCKTDEIISAGTRIKVGEVRLMPFDDQDQRVLPVEWDGATDPNERFVLEKEYKKVLM